MAGQQWRGRRSTSGHWRWRRSRRRARARRGPWRIRRCGEELRVILGVLGSTLWLRLNRLSEIGGGGRPNFTLSRHNIGVVALLVILRLHVAVAVAKPLPAGNWVDVAGAEPTPAIAEVCLAGVAAREIVGLVKFVNLYTYRMARSAIA
eukprot:6178395-Pleurochrysis_carterae.AAC.4